MSSKRSWGVADWLAWQQRLHPSDIELGLDRVSAVADSMGLDRPAPLVISVAGTNGKGSCVQILAALLEAAGRTVAAYTSPHLLRYNERIRVDGESISDAGLCEAFAAVEAARGDIPLTYFEFGTLAAIHAIAQAGVDAALLEVGLGGRLDAVNVVDADAALVSSVDLDHREWLGHDRETIGSEKAGIFRSGAVAVSADPRTPQSVRDQASRLGCRYFERDRDFTFETGSRTWDWIGPSRQLLQLPLLTDLPGDRQRANAAGCLMILDALGEGLPVDSTRQALASVALPGRIQQVGTAPDRYLDVGHNPAAGAALADWVAVNRRPESAVHLVVAMLKDKDHRGYLQTLSRCVDHWYFATTPGDRGYDGSALRTALEGSARGEAFESVEAAWTAAVAAAAPTDMVIACGSFLTVEAVLRTMEPDL